MESKLLALLLLTTLLCNYCACFNERIYGGNIEDITKAPWMVSIAVVRETFPNGSANVYSCGGTILRKNLILTAAHCNTNDDGGLNEPGKYYVNVGTNHGDLTGGTIHSVKTVFRHPKYKGGGSNHFFHDVGLLELANDIELNDRSQLVKLAHQDDDPQSGTIGTITGYGKNPDHPGDNRLYQIHIPVITTEECIQVLAGGTEEQVKQHQICAQEKGKNQCQGDSGGPFHDVSTNRQVGIVSYGAQDCTSDTPSVLARVTDNLDFIQMVIKKTTSLSSPQSLAPSPSQPNRPMLSFFQRPG